MQVVMEMIARADGVRFIKGVYLKWFDHDKPDWDFTRDMREAMVFPDATSMWEFYNRQSRSQPLRPLDGKPNKPMKMFEVRPWPADLRGLVNL